MTRDKHTIVVAGRHLRVERILIPTSDLKIDPQNPRIKYKLKGNFNLTNKELIQILMEDPDVQRLLMNINDNKGLHVPILVTQNNHIIEGNCRAAAYVKLFERDSRPDSLWAQISAERILDELSDKEIAILQGHYHITGKNKWKKYEKAGHIHYMNRSLHMEPEQIRKVLGLQRQTVETLLVAYDAMNQHYLPVFGQKEADPLRKFSYFEELIKRDDLKAYREDQNFIKEFSQWASDPNKLPEGRDVRFLGGILKRPKVRRIFEKHGMQEAKKALGKYEPILESGIFKLVQRTTDELKKLKLREAEDIHKNRKKQKLLRELIRAAQEVVKVKGNRKGRNG